MSRLLLGVELFAGLAIAMTATTYVLRSIGRRAPEAGPDEERIGLIDAAVALATECWALAIVLLSIPSGRLTGRCTPIAVRGPLILVHGFGLNRGCYWLMRRRLVRDDWGPVCSFDYRSIRVDMDTAARDLRDLVEKTASRIPDKPLTLIGFGIGGLIIRYFARRYPAPRLRRIVTLGTPHFGTELARWSNALCELAPGSSRLNALNAGDRLPQQFDVIAIHSSFDATVLPANSAHYPQAFNIQVNDVGHYSLLFSRKVYRLLAENLEAPFGK